jgi:hypothetical protein
MADADQQEHTQQRSRDPQDHIEKLVFTAVAAPGPSSDSGKALHNIADLPPFIQKGPPATRKEVWSYYAFYAADNGIGTFQ